MALRFTNRPTTSEYPSYRHRRKYILSGAGSSSSWKVYAAQHLCQQVFKAPRQPTPHPAHRQQRLPPQGRFPPPHPIPDPLRPRLQPHLSGPTTRRSQLALRQACLILRTLPQRQHIKSGLFLYRRPPRQLMQLSHKRPSRKPHGLRLPSTTGAARQATP